MNLEKDLRTNLEKYNCQVQMTSVEHLADLEKELTNYQKQGMISRELMEEYLKRFFAGGRIPPKAKSIIIVAMPQPITQVDFYTEQQKYPVVIPPTYLAKDDHLEVKRILSETLNPWGYRIEEAFGIPLKLLAVRTGLGKYGKNNICYVPGMGSFHRLFGFYSDLFTTTELWIEKEMMAACTSCSACLKNCPTGCILPDQFIIQAEKCLTFFNESEKPFPEWLDKSWHHALIGCIKCQLICPENQKYLKKVMAKVDFQPDETMQFLNRIAFEKISAKTQEKIRSLEMEEVYDQFCRNLGAVIRD